MYETLRTSSIDVFEWTTLNSLWRSIYPYFRNVVNRHDAVPRLGTVNPSSQAWIILFWTDTRVLHTGRFEISLVHHSKTCIPIVMLQKIMARLNVKGSIVDHYICRTLLSTVKTSCKARVKALDMAIGHTTGPRLNIKTVLSTYGDFHVKDKTAVRTSYL